MDFGVVLIFIVVLGMFVFFNQKEQQRAEELFKIKLELAQSSHHGSESPVTSRRSTKTRRRKSSKARRQSSSSEEAPVATRRPQKHPFLDVDSAVSESEVSPKDSKTLELVSALEAKNRELRRQLGLVRVSNVVEDNEQARLRLGPSDVETLRAIFNMFDTTQSGAISGSDISSLHSKLGEPLTEEESTQALHELDPEGRGSVSFMSFLTWWADHHQDGGKKGSQYTSRFKLLSAKLLDRQFNIDRLVVQESGQPGTTEYRLGFYYKNSNGTMRRVSVWHDVPLYHLAAPIDSQSSMPSSVSKVVASGVLYNFVCEIPKWTRAKFEIATGELFNPIKQDTKNGQLRFYRHGDMMFNYGCFPQTWENPHHVHTDTQCPGDNDPIDVLEIGSRQLKTGTVTAVKVLGVLALIDEGETDWKVIAISINDALAHLLHDIDDVETHLPGAVRAIREYLRDYKNYSGGSKNYFGLREQAMPRDYASKIIDECHQEWKRLHLNDKHDIVSSSHTPEPQAAAPSSLTE